MGTREKTNGMVLEMRDPLQSVYSNLQKDRKVESYYIVTSDFSISWVVIITETQMFGGTPP